MDVFIADVVATADHVRARLNKTKRINISFDEWNVWYVSGVQGHDAPWQATPRISEETYTLADAVVVGSMLITLLGHSDRVTAACLAQLVNTIAPIRTEPAGAAWRQSTFYPFALTARHARGEVLRFEPKGPTYPTSRYGDVPAIDATATHDSESGEVTVLVVNRHPDQPVRLEVGTRRWERSRCRRRMPSADRTHRRSTPRTTPTGWYRPRSRRSRSRRHLESSCHPSPGPASGSPLNGEQQGMLGT